jgi:glucuronate isomerase
MTRQSVQKIELHPDRLFSSDPVQRGIARRLYREVAELPILSPHGHTDPAWFSENRPFADPASLLVIPDHYLFRMLYSQGVGLDRLGIARADGKPGEVDKREVWRVFARHYHLLRGTPSFLWLEATFQEVFGLELRLGDATADHYFDHIAGCLAREEFLPRSLMDRFGIELIATTEGATDAMDHHGSLQDGPWARRVITTFRPDDVVDPDREDFGANLEKLGELTGEDTSGWGGYLRALRARRRFFKSLGATATDHGHPTARTANLERSECKQLFKRCLRGEAGTGQRELFRAQMLTEMAAMSLEDGLVMQIHPGAWRNHNPLLLAQYGRDVGADIPTRTGFVEELKPLLDRFGNEGDLTVILFTLDESVYSRELAPLAGHYPALLLGPPWWFHDSPEGMLRYRRCITETAGFYNTAGFNDDTRAFLSIPARHDVARRVDARFLARLVSDHRITEDDAGELARELAYGLARRAYRLGEPAERPVIA